MDKNIFNERNLYIKETYNLDIVHDIILNRDDQIILFTDLDKGKSDLMLINGSLSQIGFQENDGMTLEDFYQSFDFNNAYARVRGEKEYFQEIKSYLEDVTQEVNTTFPVLTQKGKFWLRFHRIPIKSNPNYLSVYITNVTKYLDEEEALFYKTHHDSLTGLFNKYILDYHYGVRYKYDNFHVLYLDLDNFKGFNDSLGHNAGNAYLEAFAAILKMHESNHNSFYRLGGDEFVGLFFESADKVKGVAEDIVKKTQALATKFDFTDTSVSIGILQATIRDDVIRKADKVMYKAKNQGKNQWLYEIEK